MQPPETQYARRDGTSIAFQVVGDGPQDTLISPGFISHLDLIWADPGAASFLGRLSSFTRLILYDKAGTGLSDPVPTLPTLEDRAVDIAAVMQAAGSQEATILAISEGGPSAALLAATRPDLVRSLILYGSFAVWPAVAPEAYSSDSVAACTRIEAELGEMLNHWGDGSLLELFAPSSGEMQRRQYGMFARAAASPRMAEALVETMKRLDVREVMSSIRVPTLVLHVQDDRVIPVEAAELMANGIPSSQLKILPGIDHSFWLGEYEAIADEIEQFVTGSVQATKPSRVLATLLFTDIVSSTQRAAEWGDRKWREALERHDSLVDETVLRHGGRVIKHAGDGALSSFDGPARAVRCAEDLGSAIRQLGLEIRAGIHTGECELVGGDLSGLAVHIGARVGSLAEPNEILVSSTVKELLVGSGIAFADIGEHELKGVPGSWRVYSVRGMETAAPKLDGAADHMRLSDKLAIYIARKAPSVARAGARLVKRNSVDA